MNNIPMNFWIATCIVVVHVVLCHFILERVKRENPPAFERMGSPHLFLNNTPGSTWLFWKWLCSSDPNSFTVGTRTLAWIIRLLTVVFLGWFLFQVVAIFW